MIFTQNYYVMFIEAEAHIWIFVWWQSVQAIILTCFQICDMERNGDLSLATKDEVGLTCDKFYIVRIFVLFLKQKI